MMGYFSLVVRMETPGEMSPFAGGSNDPELGLLSKRGGKANELSDQRRQRASCIWEVLGSSNRFDSLLRVKG
jgi:hypothetical protein